MLTALNKTYKYFQKWNKSKVGFRLQCLYRLSFLFYEQSPQQRQMKKIHGRNIGSGLDSNLELPDKHHYAIENSL